MKRMFILMAFLVTGCGAVNVSALNNTSLVGMGMLANDTVTVSATGVFADKNVGTNKTVNLTSTYGGSDAGNYNIVSQVNTTANITAKDVTLAAPQATQVYNGSAIYTANATQLAALSTQLGVVGDSVSNITLAYNNKNAATGKTLTASSASISAGSVSAFTLTTMRAGWPASTGVCGSAARPSPPWQALHISSRGGASPRAAQGPPSCARAADRPRGTSDRKSVV